MAKFSAICTYCHQSFTLPSHRMKVAKFCNQVCYHAHREATKGPPQKQAMATCHPDKPLAGLGLCSTCYSRQDREKKIDNYREAARRYSLKKFYRMSLEDYDSLFAQQKGLCAICKRPGTKTRGLMVDHCHRTTNVRKLLCYSCNTGLGHFRDSSRLLQQASAYLFSFENTL